MGDISFNNLSGPLPKELGSWANIERMLLSSNNFTWELPETFAMLTKIKEFVSDSHFSGQIPDFIGNCTSLKKLLIQASGLTGPIPSGISLLTSLTDLMLRSCNLVGRLPPNLGQMAKLETLDLSFNKLTGEIPSSFASLAKVDYIFLTGNLLTGPVPTWPKDVVHVNAYLCSDLSYNNLTIGDGGCLPPGGMNLFASSSKDNSS
ncbi:probable leucine-rich repeat receptor-like serine/threonine-protein kinase At3g14840 [Pyrus x bretschneideri]|uniref:probable leucine-rich repeat receptor-like serine/threonine-protein kinase At3g14840 n=1 Tax=Pyrus x bretschneideri TaxID=225117 RepID=UPI002030A2D4|nr:probable leucine-rich repeat receptor-like serine/threonine-protein kinase At3g14840 [Pyrus x bretschneideri]